MALSGYRQAWMGQQEAADQHPLINVLVVDV